MTLAYVTSAPLPTQKAHGAQIAQMCDAFSELGLDVELWHAERGHGHPLTRTDTRSFFGLDDAVVVRTFPRRVLRWGMKLSWTPLPILYWIQSFVWSIASAFRAAARGSDFTCFTRHPDVAFWMTIFGVRTILEVHDVPRRMGKRLLRFATRRPEVVHIVCLTAGIRDKLVALGVPAEKCAVEPDAVDLDRFRVAPTKNVCRERLGLPLHRAIVGYVGKFEAMGQDKGIGTLVLALAEIQDRSSPSPPPLLVCVGGPMESVPEYLEIAAEAGLDARHVRFLDHVPMSQVPLWVKSCDVATIPLPWTEWSAYYTSPLKMFEYMAAQVPIVASDLPSTREVLDTSIAWLVKPDDVQAWAGAIQDALESGDGRADAAAELVQDHTWNKRVARIWSRATLQPASNG